MAVGSVRACLHGSAPLLSCIGNGSVPLCRQHCADSGVAGGGFGAEIGPCVEICNRVDDAGADFAIGGTRAVNPVFFQRARRKAEISGCFGSPQVSWRQAGVRIRHLRGSVVVWCPGEIAGASADTMAEGSLQGGCRRLGGTFSAPLRKLSFLPQRWTQ